MRSLTLALIAALCTLSSYAQSSEPAMLAAQPGIHHSTEFLDNELPTLASLNKSQYYADYKMAADRSDAKCGKYKKMKMIGIILSGVGGGLIVGGAVMIGVAVHNVANGNGTLNNVGLAGGGYACVVFGVFSTGAGIPLAVIGSVKQKKYCSGTSTLMLHSGENGTGLALNF